MFLFITVWRRYYVFAMTILRRNVMVGSREKGWTNVSLLIFLNIPSIINQRDGVTRNYSTDGFSNLTWGTFHREFLISL